MWVEKARIAVAGKIGKWTRLSIMKTYQLKPSPVTQPALPCTARWSFQRSAPVDAEDPDNVLIRPALAESLPQFPSEQRAVVHAGLCKKRTLHAAAVALGVSINTAASRYRYALDKMREQGRSLYEDLAWVLKST